MSETSEKPPLFSYDTGGRYKRSCHDHGGACRVSSGRMCGHKRTMFFFRRVVTKEAPYLAEKILLWTKLQVLPDQQSQVLSVT